MGSSRHRLGVFFLLSVLTFPSSPSAAEDMAELLANAEAFLHENTLYLALERLREAARVAPQDYRVHKIHGDVLMSFRRNQEALMAYREAVAAVPDALDAHWALWSLLDRMGAYHPAIESLKEIVRIDPDNALVYLRLARALSQADRLEEAVESYRHAVELAPDNLAVRLQYGRALFDILEYGAAQEQVNRVLAHAVPESAEWAAARDLLAHLQGGTYDKGRRFDYAQTLQQRPWFAQRNSKAWVSARSEGWQWMKQGRYAEAEAAFRQALTYNPQDHRAMYDLGLTLMELGRYEEAIESFENGIELTKFGEFYPDSVFQIGHCLAQLGRWQEAVARYERVLEIQDWRHEEAYGMNFPDLAKVQEALDEARRHLPSRAPEVSMPISQHGERFGPEPYEYRIPPFANGQQMVDPIPLAPKITPMGTDSVQGAFRQVMTARDVVQDDLQTGLHEYMPLNPTDTFLQQDAAIYVVFTLTSNQEDLEVKLTSHWMAERTAGLASNTLVGTDTVLLGLNERSGYFVLPHPEGGWQPGIYRIDLYLGPEVSAYTQVADIRFRVLADGKQEFRHAGAK